MSPTDENPHPNKHPHTQPFHLQAPIVVPAIKPKPAPKAIRHLSINRAKGLDAVAVIVVGVAPFASLTRIDDQYTYFMGASRAKQLLAVVEGA